MTNHVSTLIVLMFCTLFCAAAQAQVGNPADKAVEANAKSNPQPQANSAEMEAIVVEGLRLHEEARIGSYLQPRWTAFRRFPGTRVYVRPEGYVGIEQWYRFEDRRHGSTATTAQSEIEFGLPHRFQVDLYLTHRREYSTGPTYSDSSVELRYAFADWGALWGNPAVYLEWTAQDAAPDKVEGKLLLGDEFSEGWHWGANLVCEYTMGGNGAREYEATLGVSRTLRDDKLSLGVESLLSGEDQAGSRGHYQEDYRLGPSLQYRPLPRMHIDFAPLFGLTSSSKRADVYVILGWEF